MLFVAKDEDGTIQRLVIGDDEDFGALLASIIPLDGGGLMETAVGDGSSGFEADDAWALAESLSPGTALAFLLIEHGWAQPLFDAIAAGLVEEAAAPRQSPGPARSASSTDPTRPLAAATSRPTVSCGCRRHPPLHVGPGIERGGDERVSQAVRPDPLADASRLHG